MNKRIKINEKNVTPSILEEIKHNGDIAICPVCDKELILVLDENDMKRHQMHAGAYCSNNTEHFHMMIELKSIRKKFLDQFGKDES